MNLPIIFRYFLLIFRFLEFRTPAVFFGTLPIVLHNLFKNTFLILGSEVKR